ncbi:MAG: glutamine-hydrolyzing GMP synthase, partial [Methylococcales bacterium]
MDADSPHPDIHLDKILIIDFGSQYTQLIARRIREIGVYCEIHPWDCSNQTVSNFNPRGIILSGGPETVTEQDAPRAPTNVFELGVPVLGICYGMQTMTTQLGGQVEASDQREFGYAQVAITQHSTLLDTIEDHLAEDDSALLDVWMSHGDRVQQLPQGFECIGSSENAPVAAIADQSRQFYGLQFHPEVT